MFGAKLAGAGKFVGDFLQYTPSDGRIEWCVSLDPTTWTFALCKCRNEETSIKYLPKAMFILMCRRNIAASILCKFLKRVKCCKNMIKKSNEEYLNCYYCKKWFDGFCAKHPLIFIRETIPSVVPYTAHMTVPSFLKVRLSSIDGGGQGVFALFDLPRGLTFGPYGGKLSYKIWAQNSGYSWLTNYARGRSD
uniref:Uncharacterized protein n=1 Tax=Romanomermis culicivorax TaxID=13658 RepID=A0A915I279_ROMCU